MAQLKITQKGMMIVSVPLVFETVFILLLLFLLNQVNQQIEREENARAVLATAHHFGRMAINISTAVASIRFEMDDGRGHEKFDASLRAAQEDVDQMLELTKNDPREHKIVMELADCVAYAKTLEGRQQSNLETSAKLDALAKDPLVQETADYVGRLNASVQHLVADEQRTAAESLEELHKTRTAIEVVLAGGLFASILITVWLTLFFSRNIIQRIHALAANASFLGKRQPLAVTVSGHDEIAELDAALRRTDAELAQLERTRQNLIAFVSHELKTPLTSLSAFFSLLSNGAFIPLTETSGEVARSAIARLDDINRLILDLIDVEKLQGGKFKLLLSDVDIPTLIDLAVEKFKSNVRGMPAEVDVPEVPVLPVFELSGGIADTVIMADRDRLVRVLTNLFRNAAHRAELDMPCAIDVRVTEEEGWVEFQLTDRGIPVQPQLRACVFERNQLTGDAHMLNMFLSDGLPLVISRMIVEEHGGSFSVVSDNVEQMTSFVFRLPTDLVAEPPLTESKKHAILYG